MTKDINNLERRCPKLGSQVKFQYCMDFAGDGELPCLKIIDCWWEYFDILQYLNENFSEKEVELLVNTRPKSKVSSLVELIEQAKNRRAK